MTFKRSLIALIATLTTLGVLAFDFWPQVPDKDTVVVTDGVQEQQESNIECKEFQKRLTLR
ncbi:hypothetical protein JCM19236_5406 [Vibrio sp. JCM 19236]|nr:hypothetical protein JCM19236_5406 [Vibrio sp. JCM 19236]